MKIKVKEDIFEFNETNHSYKLNGIKLPGCTTILSMISKPALIQWSANETARYIRENCFHNHEGYKVNESDLIEASKAHSKKKTDAGDWGTIVHKGIEVWIKTGGCTGGIITDEVEIKGEIFKIQEDHKVAIEQFITWAKSNNVKFLESEKILYSKEMNCAGTCDFVCEIDGKIFLGDTKTSSNIYEEFFYQTAAYSAMLKELELYTIEGMVIVNLKKDGTFKVEQNMDVEGNLEAFKAALVLFKKKNNK